MQAKSNPTLKDLDFTESGEKISIGAEEKDRVLKTLERDVQVFFSKNSLHFICIYVCDDLVVAKAEFDGLQPSCWYL